MCISNPQRVYVVELVTMEDDDVIFDKMDASDYGRVTSAGTDTFLTYKQRISQPPNDIALDDLNKALHDIAYYQETERRYLVVKAFELGKKHRDTLPLTKLNSRLLALTLLYLVDKGKPTSSGISGFLSSIESEKINKLDFVRYLRSVGKVTKI